MKIIYTLVVKLKTRNRSSVELRFSHNDFHQIEEEIESFKDKYCSNHFSPEFSIEVNTGEENYKVDKDKDKVVKRVTKTLPITSTAPKSKRGRKPKYPKEMKEFIKELKENFTNKEILEQIKRKFGIEIKLANLKRYIQHWKLFNSESHPGKPRKNKEAFDTDLEKGDPFNT